MVENMTSAANPDYPRMAAERGRVEPAPRRVRGFIGGDLIFDTTEARYVWEVPYYPQYYIPLRDIRAEYLIDDDRSGQSKFGHSRLESVTTETSTAKSAARVFDDPDSPVAGYVRFDWKSVEWYEEDERIVGHPRNPYVRVDALRSHRHVKVELDGVVLAETTSPVLLFETGLPTRYYVDRTDVSFTHLTPSETQSLCPYKGTTSGTGPYTSAMPCTPTSRGRTTIPCRPWLRSPVWSRSTTRRSTSTSTVSGCRGQARTSADAGV